MTPPTTPQDLNLHILRDHSKNNTTRKLQTERMSKPKPLLPVTTTLYLSLLFLHTHFSISNGVSVLAINSLKNSDIDVMVRRVCTQNIEDCLSDPEMDTETNRRVLVMQKKYISYETLKRDMVPCTRPGASYYDCHAGEANPYSRGCEVITRCARGIKETNN